MTRAAWIRVGVLALLALVAGWLLTATEWAEVEVDTPPRGQAARDDFFALEQWLPRLGVQLKRQRTLDTLPPADAVLVLESRHWDLFPERDAQLRDWVGRGGHLVIPADPDEELPDWVAVRQVRPSGAARTEPRPAKPPGEPACRTLVASGHALPAETAPPIYSICTRAPRYALERDEDAVPQWALAGPRGAEILRVPYGQGSVTVNGAWDLMRNRHLLRAESASVVAATLQLQRGSRVWLVTEETRMPLLRWAWQEGAVAIVLAAAALAAWLWRGWVRFGPVGAVPAPERRSMKEQLAGTAAYLRRHGPAALHAAQARALQEAAAACLPGHASLRPEQRIEAIARIAALDAGALARALRFDARRTPFLADDLGLLEEARRRLLRASPTLRSSTAHAHQA